MNTYLLSKAKLMLTNKKAGIVPICSASILKNYKILKNTTKTMRYEQTNTRRGVQRAGKQEICTI